MAIIDMELRYSFVQLALDIEHYAKLKILRMTEDHSEDGYQMCTDFMNTLDENQRERLKGEISRNEHSVYCGELFAKYPEHFPVWVFLEMIPFGRLVSFYGFCANRYCDSDMEKEYYMLMACKEIRNAAAHSSCILNNLHPETAEHEISREIMSEIAKMKEISKSQRIKRMSNERMRQIITLLYTHKKIVTSAGVHQKSKKLMHAFDERMMRNIAYYQSNDLVRKTFAFLHRVMTTGSDAINVGLHEKTIRRFIRAVRTAWLYFFISKEKVVPKSKDFQGVFLGIRAEVFLLGNKLQ